MDAAAPSVVSEKGSNSVEVDNGEVPSSQEYAPSGQDGEVAGGDTAPSSESLPVYLKARLMQLDAADGAAILLRLIIRPVASSTCPTGAESTVLPIRVQITSQLHAFCLATTLTCLTWSSQMLKSSHSVAARQRVDKHSGAAHTQLYVAFVGSL